MDLYKAGTFIFLTTMLKTPQTRFLFSPIPYPMLHISIPREEYRRLCQATIDLLKANKTIGRLNLQLAKKDAIIAKLQDTKEKSSSHLSPVS